MYHVTFHLHARRWIITDRKLTLTIRSKESLAQAKVIRDFLNEDPDGHRLAMSELAARVAA